MYNQYRIFISLLLVLAVIACQKELDDGRDPNATGILVKDSAANCSLITINGTFKVGKSLNDSNSLSVTVDIATTGNYTIYTDTVNGYSFRATGIFSVSGQQTLQLKGTGIPTSMGTDRFTVHFLNSTCQTTIGIQPAVPIATFTLAGAPNGCTNATLSGTFLKGVDFDGSSYVSITINVATAGTYTIATNYVNGFSFTASGIFSATGMQSVRLYATGIPANAGTNTFAITANNTTCHFTVPVMVQPDYFPLTINSYWVYTNLLNPSDSISRTVIGTSTTGVGLYNSVLEQKIFGTQQLLFRKSGSDYFEYGSVTKYTTSFAFRNPILAGIVFLKTNVAAGVRWQSPEYTDTASFGQVISLRYNYVCDEVNANVTINGQSFSNVLKVMMYPEIKAQGNNWGNTSEYYFSYFAKDIGLIYEKKVNNNFTVSEMGIARWQVY